MKNKNTKADCCDIRKVRFNTSENLEIDDHKKEHPFEVINNIATAFTFNDICLA